MSAPPMFSVSTAAAGTPAVKDLGLAWKQFMGIPDTGSGWRTLAEMGRAPADEAWVYACVRRRYTAAMGVPLKVYVKDARGPGPAIRLTSADQSSNQAAKDLQLLLDDVNPVDMQGGDLKAYLEAGLAVWGEGYIQKVRGRLGGPPQELYWLRAADVTPDPEYGPGPITGYRYRPNGLAQATAYPTKDIIAYRTVNLADPRRGLSPLSASRNEMRVNLAASETTASTLENWGVPAGAWVAPKGADISTQDQRLITRALKALRGPRNQGRTPVLPEGLAWTPMALNAKDAEWLAARKVSRMTVCAALGVPLVLAGDDDSNSVYGNLRDAERIFWRNTMIPELDWIADGLNSWLVPDFTTKRDIVVAFDYTAIESLRAAPAEEMAQWLEAVKLGLPLNRYISKFGMGDPVDGGDESRVLLGRAGDVGLTTGDQSADAPVAPIAPASKPRPAEYSTGKAAVIALGKGLYKHEAVRAYLASGDPATLESLVPEWEVETLALGLQRRLPAAKLAETWDPTPATHQPTVNIYADADRVEYAVKAAATAAFEDTLERLRGDLADVKRSVLATVAVETKSIRADVAAIEERANAPRPQGVKVLVRDDMGRTVVYVKDGTTFDVTRDDRGRIVESVPRG